MGCLKYIVIGLAVIWAVKTFGLMHIILAFIVGWIVYEIFS